MDLGLQAEGSAPDSTPAWHTVFGLKGAADRVNVFGSCSSAFTCTAPTTKRIRRICSGSDI